LLAFAWSGQIEPAKVLGHKISENVCMWEEFRGEVSEKGGIGSLRSCRRCGDVIQVIPAIFCLYPALKPAVLSNM
jgi:hypothetical protein